MAKLYFSYSAMNAGKSTSLLQVAHNYGEQDMEAYLMTAALDDRSGEVGKIVSRIGVEKQADVFDESTDLLNRLSAVADERVIAAVLIDEAQ